jgi:hypothetical protein
MAQLCGVLHSSTITIVARGRFGSPQCVIPESWTKLADFAWSNIFWLIRSLAHGAPRP